MKQEKRDSACWHFSYEEPAPDDMANVSQQSGQYKNLYIRRRVIKRFIYTIWPMPHWTTLAITDAASAGAGLKRKSTSTLPGTQTVKRMGRIVC